MLKPHSAPNNVPPTSLDVQAVPVQGTVVSLHICVAASAPMQTVDSVQAVAGRGIEGDRYFLKTGTYSKKDAKDRHFTLIEAEQLEALERDYGHALSPAESRRNGVTRGASLNHYVGRAFRIGDVVLRGIRLCEPCGYLEKVTGKPVFNGLVHRAGLRCEIVQSGTIRLGDRIVEV